MCVGKGFVWRCVIGVGCRLDRQGVMLVRVYFLYFMRLLKNICNKSYFKNVIDQEKIIITYYVIYNIYKDKMYDYVW